MFILDHKIWPKQKYRLTLAQEESHFFLTVTLPKRYYSKPVYKQKEVMDKILKSIFEDLSVAYAYGTYELTNRGNVHAHCICYISREIFRQNHDNEESRIDDMTESEILTISRVLLKPYGICDIQPVKSMDNVEVYMQKDLDITTQAFKAASPIPSETANSPCFRYYYNKQQEIIDNVERDKVYKKQSCPLANGGRPTVILTPEEMNKLINGKLDVEIISN